MKKKAKFTDFLVMTFLLIASTFIFYLWRIEKAKKDSIVEHNISDNYHPPEKGIFWDNSAYYTKPELTYDQIDNAFKPDWYDIIFFFVLYILLGRMLVLFAQGLSSLFDILAKDINSKFGGNLIVYNNWAPERVLYGTALPPITAVIIVYFIIATFLVFIYRYFV